jgi:hypothetical protein
MVTAVLVELLVAVVQAQQVSRAARTLLIWRVVLVVALEYLVKALTEQVEHITLLDMAKVVEADLVEQTAGVVELVELMAEVGLWATTLLT